MIGFFWRGAVMGDISETAWKYWALTVPVSTITGPVGSFLGSHLHRQVVAAFVYVLELAALIGFLCNRPPWHLIYIGAAIIVGGYVFFTCISRGGQRLLDRIEGRVENRQAASGTAIDPAAA